MSLPETTESPNRLLAPDSANVDTLHSLPLFHFFLWESAPPYGRELELERAMSDSDLSDDDDDLFADFDKAECDQVNVSANLIDDIGEDNVAQKSKDATDGKTLDWIAPAVHGLKNSLTVTQASSGQHWYRDDDFKNLPDTNRSTKVDWVNMPSRGDVATGSAPPASSAASSSTPANTTAFMQQQPSPKMATTDMMTPGGGQPFAGGTVTAAQAAPFAAAPPAAQQAPAAPAQFSFGSALLSFGNDGRVVW